MKTQTDKTKRASGAPEAQAQHSPLPWTLDNQGKGISQFTELVDANDKEIGYLYKLGELEKISTANAKLIIASVNNAERLAEACKSMAKLSEGWTTEQMNLAITRAQKALAAWEGAKQ